MAEKRKEPTEGRREGGGARERGTKTERGERREQIIEGMKESETAEDEPRKEASQQIPPVPNCYIHARRSRAFAPRAYEWTDRRMGPLIEILSAVLHRPLIGRLGGGEEGPQWSSADWAVG